MKKNPDHSTETNISREKNRKKIIYAIIIVLNSILFYGIFAVLTRFSFWKTVEIVYLAALVAVGAFYVIYNRGFTRKNVSIDMLPNTMSEEEKRAYVEDGENRLKKSKWCIAILFPLLFTFFMDRFYLFVFEPYFAETFSGLFG